jgi:hypothetical protein
VDEYRELRQQLMSRLARIEGRLDKVEKDRRRGSNTPGAGLGGASHCPSKRRSAGRVG